MTNRCSGQCCKIFTIKGKSLDELKKLAWLDNEETTEKTLNMLIPLPVDEARKDFMSSLN